MATRIANKPITPVTMPTIVPVSSLLEDEEFKLPPLALLRLELELEELVVVVAADSEETNDKLSEFDIVSAGDIIDVLMGSIEATAIQRMISKQTGRHRGILYGPAAQTTHLWIRSVPQYQRYR